MKELYKAPEISVEELAKTDVLCDSIPDLGANRTMRGRTLIQSIEEDIFGDN